MISRPRCQSLARDGAAATATLALAAFLVGGLADASAAQAATGWSAPTRINPYVGGVPIRWTGQVRRNHFIGALIGLESLSCASPTFCVAVGGALETHGRGARRKEYERGYVLTFNGHAWSRPLRVQGQLQLRSVSCPSSSFCAAVGNQITGPSTFAGYTLTYNGHSWSRPVLRVKGPIEQGERPSELEMIACASRSFCVATSTAGEALFYNGRSWSKPVASYPKGGLVALACPATSKCIAIANVPSRETSRETTKEGATVIRELAFQEAFALTFNGSTWGTPRLLPVTGRVASLSCPTASFCLALGNASEDSGVALTFNGSSWSSPEPITPHAGGVGMISCASPAFCVAIEDEEAVLTFNGSSWGVPTVIDPGATLLGARGLVALSCPSALFCLALDASGHARYYPAGAVPPPHERRATLSVSPSKVRAGGHVHVFGSVGRFNGEFDCAPGEQVTLSSPAFQATLSGPTVYAKVARNGTFSARANVPAWRTASLYTVEGACRTGDLEVTANLQVLG